MNIMKFGNIMKFEMEVITQQFGIFIEFWKIDFETWWILWNFIFFTGSI